MQSITRGIKSRRPTYSSLLLLVLVALTLVPSSGCVLALAGAAAAGAGAIAYSKGDVEQHYPYPLEVVWEASLAALAESELYAVPSARDQLSARIDATTATGDKIKLVLTAQGSTTHLNLRVNTFGDTQLSAELLQRIAAHIEHPHLAELPPVEHVPGVLPPPPEMVFPAQ